MKSLLNSRFIFFMIFLACAASLGYAFYLEYVHHMEPCVLCWVQRALFAGAGIICFIGFIHNPQGVGRRIYAFLGLIFSILGIVAAGRQIWLKFNPDNSGCLPTTIESIFEDNPFFEAILKAFEGTPECGLFQGDVLGIELPYWGIMLFSAITLVLIYQLCRSNPLRMIFN